MHVKFVLNPRLTYTELPLKTYHRYAMAAPHGADDAYVIISDITWDTTCTHDIHTPH